MRNVFKILVLKTEWMRSLGRLRGRWEGNIRIKLKKNIVGDCGLASSGS
jgi:hypothetical protein